MERFQVTVVGPIAVDILLQKPIRGWPQPGEVVTSSRYRECVGGTGCNVATVARTLVGDNADGAVVLVSKRGNEFADLLTTTLTDRRLEDVTVVPDSQTRFVVVFTEPHDAPLSVADPDDDHPVRVGPDREMIAVGGAPDKISIEDLRKCEFDESAANVLFLSGVGSLPGLEVTERAPPQTANAVSECLSGLRKKGVIIGIDTLMHVDAHEAILRSEAKRHASYWTNRLGPLISNVDWFMPSDNEATLLTNIDDPEKSARHLLDTYGNLRLVAIKRNENGVYLAARDGRTASIEAIDTTVIDPTGAGDAWCAGFVVGWLHYHSFVRATIVGHAAAHFCLRAVGACEGRKSWNEVCSLAAQHPHWNLVGSSATRRTSYAACPRRTRRGHVRSP